MKLGVNRIRSSGIDICMELNLEWEKSSVNVLVCSVARDPAFLWSWTCACKHTNRQLAELLGSARHLDRSLDRIVLFGLILVMLPTLVALVYLCCDMYLQNLVGCWDSITSPDHLSMIT